MSPQLRPAPVDAFVALGSNLGDRRATLTSALDALARLPLTRLIRCSNVIETEAVGPPDQPPYLNAVVHLSTRLSARPLLDCLLAIERQHGRDRAVERRWGPRPLDLDLLLFGRCVIDEPGLVVPHPRLHQRRFVLAPLADIAPDTVVPTFGRTVADLLAALDASR